MRMGAVVAVCVFALLLAQAGRASNSPDTRLDAVASTIAQHPVAVYCENDSQEWTDWERLFGGARLAGFTYPDYLVEQRYPMFQARTVYIAPSWCLPLLGLVGGEDVGTFEASEAILVLTHEAIHQRLNSGDEAVVECVALKEFRAVAVALFHVPETISETYVATVTRVVKRGKKRVRVQAAVSRIRQVPNPYLERLLRDANRWHATLPGSYQGGVC